MRLTVTLVIIAALFVNVSTQYGEPDSDGNPGWRERESHVIVNAIRSAPIKYVTTYYTSYASDFFMSPAMFPAVPPLYLTTTDSHPALLHAQDMAFNNCFNHSDCGNNTSFEQRIKKYVTTDCLGQSYGENIAAGLDNGRGVSWYLLCENDTIPCAADSNTLNTGHRRNIMSPTFKSMGIGYAYSAQADYSYYWTQDFTAATCPSQTNPIYGGSHSFVDSNLVYYANWWKTAPATSKIYIKAGNNAVVSHDLTLHLGNSTLGTFIYNSTTQYTECQLYAFVFTVGDATYRYPDTGSLATLTSTASKCAAWSSTNIIPSPSTSTSTTSSNPATTSTSTTSTAQTTTTTKDGTTTSQTTTSTTSTQSTGTTSTTRDGTTTSQSTSSTTSTQSTGTTSTTRDGTTTSTGTTKPSTTTTSTTTTSPVTTTTEGGTTQAGTTKSSTVSTSASTTTTGQTSDPTHPSMAITLSGSLHLGLIIALLFVALLL
ncbi:hypothetical protein SAMD00019534_076550 [Acytostelium subglobosum LB1]|uniref:hypothetical protein n=1 Tax=Acytostelium subglobosum LB1 TaxID=1410327 RepID=UPI000644D15E|nr:hypothetical protein SAMD00019534_076550 [Acytostelium subglobosum LB1]GAM24480.1 hypothetical protein SAMD00019534_076550 [Acytostelium subglobosum LB1]|eukprot:XP_012752806.1 hypothetical protein SAMD00019534_076550 [Acytostelium subglobosum LB1]